MTDDFPLLKDFFSAYFHEDWSCDASSTNDVVLEFKRDQSAVHVRAVADAIRSIVHTFPNDTDLENSLFHDLGCYYMPSGEGKSAREWLEGVTSLLLDSR